MYNPLLLFRYASVPYALYPCPGHRALRFRPARLIRSATTREAMVDPRAVTRRARSPTRARARASRQVAHVPAPSPTHARLADKAPSRLRDMGQHFRWTAQVGASSCPLPQTNYNLFLVNFIDDHTPSRIPQRKASAASTTSGTGTGTTPRPARLSVATASTPGSRLNGTSTITRKTASGSASPAPTR